MALSNAMGGGIADVAEAQVGLLRGLAPGRMNALACQVHCTGRTGSEPGAANRPDVDLAIATGPGFCHRDIQDRPCWVGAGQLDPLDRSPAVPVRVAQKILKRPPPLSLTVTLSPSWSKNVFADSGRR